MTTPTYAPNELSGLTEERRRSIMAVLVFIGAVDRKWDPREQALVRPFLMSGAVWGIADALMASESEKASRLAESIRSNEGLLALGQRCAEALPSAAAREKLVNLLLALVWADDVMRPEERSVLGTFVRGLGVPEERANELAMEAEPENERIFSAIVGGELDVVRKLLDAGTSVMSRDVHQWTPLHLAASKGQLAIVELLLERGADVSATHDQGSRPIHVACNKPYEAIVARLLKAGAKVDDVNTSGFTPLAIAATTGQLGVARALRNGGASLEMPSPGEMTPLHSAAQYGHSAVVAFLLREGAAASARTKEKRTPLMLASESGDAASVTALLAADGEIDAASETGETALHGAVRGGSAGVVALLVGFGANVDAATTKHVVPLAIAALLGEVASAKHLLDAGANLDVASADGTTPILAATAFDRRAMIALLVSRGAKVDESKRAVSLPIKSLRSVPLTEPLPPAGLRPSDEALAAFGDYQLAGWLHEDGSPDQVLVSGTDRAGRPHYVGRPSKGDPRARYLVVTDSSGNRWLPLFTSDAAANAFRRATPIGWPEGGTGLARAVTTHAEPQIFAIHDLPIEGVMLDPYGPTRVTLTAEECARVARRVSKG